MAYPLTQALADPAAAARHLLHDAPIYGVEQASGRSGPGGAAILDLTLRPLPALAADDYPVEHARVVILPTLEVHAFPKAGGRPFKHRNPYPLKDLCLQYPNDDAALRWIPEDGLEALVTLIHRHLMFEEAWRRTGTWPAEDAPHGQPGRGTHPLTTTDLRREARRWTR
ncbi:hypothetical protein WN990_37070 [Kitasatospora purpeofusca]|uniref:hypothetical protein n=1 Tax=Kitasatospora purpeofusca TaxID=67352 RepID=UPI0030F0C83F